MKLLTAFILLYFTLCGCGFSQTTDLDINKDNASEERKDISELVGKSEKTVSPYFLTVVYAILFIIGGTIVFVLYKKKMLSGFGPLNTNKNVKIIETSMLGNRQFLVLAECENKRVLLGVGPGFINKLIVYSKDEDSFSDELSNHMNKED